MHLHRISSQANEPLETHFSIFAPEYGSAIDNPALKMIDVLHALAELAHPDIWVFTSLIALVLATRDDYTSAVVRINYISGLYAIEAPATREEPRFLGETSIVSYHDDAYDTARAAMTLYDQIIGA